MKKKIFEISCYVVLITKLLTLIMGIDNNVLDVLVYVYLFCDIFMIGFMLLVLLSCIAMNNELKNPMVRFLPNFNYIKKTNDCNRINKLVIRFINELKKIKYYTLKNFIWVVLLLSIIWLSQSVFMSIVIIFSFLFSFLIQLVVMNIKKFKMYNDPRTNGNDYLLSNFSYSILKKNIKNKLKGYNHLSRVTIKDEFIFVEVIPNALKDIVKVKPNTFEKYLGKGYKKYYFKILKSELNSKKIRLTDDFIYNVILLIIKDEIKDTVKNVKFK